MTSFEAGDRPHPEQTTPSTAPADSSGGRLSSRPHSPDGPPGATGLHDLDLEGEPVGKLFVPTVYRPEVPAPFALLMHGAGGDARGGIDPLLRFADAAGLLLLAPDSRDVTWDVIMRSFGADIEVMDRALGYVFARYNIDPTRLAIGGFSDGSVALFRRIHDSLSPGGTLAVMDAFAEPHRRTSAQANVLGLFMYLSSGAQVHPPALLHSWLREAGFGLPRRLRILRIPGQAMYVVTKDLDIGRVSNTRR